MKSRKAFSGEKSVSNVWLQSCWSASRAVKIQTRQKPDQLWHRQTKMSGIRTCPRVEDKDFSQITQSTAVPARRSAAVPIGSPLSLQDLPCSSPSRDLRHPACPGSTCTYLYIFFYISTQRYIYIYKEFSQKLVFSTRLVFSVWVCAGYVFC